MRPTVICFFIRMFIFAFIIFDQSTSSIFIFGAFRPGYSHSINAVSELGVLGAPNALPWNILGFVTPGVMLAVAGGAIAVSVTSKARRTFAFWLLVISGLGFAGTGIIPAEMDAGELLLTSAYTRGHFILSLFHGITWVAGSVLLIGPMSRSPDWRGWHMANLALVLGVIVASFALRGAVSDALVQRIAGAIYFTWFLIKSIRLIQLGTKEPPWMSRAFNSNH